MFDFERGSVAGARTFQIVIMPEELKYLDFKDWPDEQELIKAIHEAIYLAYARV